MDLILFVAKLEELQGVGLGEEEGLSYQHAEEVLKHESIEGREFDVCLEFFEGVAVVLHPVGYKLSQFAEEGREWLWLGLHFRRLWLDGCFLEIRCVLLLLMQLNLKSLGLNSLDRLGLLCWFGIIL